MKDMLMKKLMKADEMQPTEKMGKLAALKDLIREMDAIMSGDLEQPEEDVAMQKVSVMAPDKEGLKEGLEKAEDVLESRKLGMDLAPSSDEEEDEFEDEM